MENKRFSHIHDTQFAYGVTLYGASKTSWASFLLLV